MLYHAYEMNHAVVGPLRHLVDFNKRFCQSPYNPMSYTWAGKNVSAACDLFEAVTRRYDKPQWGLDSTTINGVSVPVKEHVVWEKPFARLLHFERDAANKAKATGKDSVDPRVLIVAPLSGHYATLLRGTVETFLPEHEVFVSDWADARNVPLSDGRFDMNDYIDYVIQMIETIGPDAHVFAVCQPGPSVLAAVSVMSENNSEFTPASMTIVGSPIDTRLSPTVPNKIAWERSYDWFKDNVIYSVPWPNKGAMRRVYPGFLQLGGFITMNRSRHVSAHKDYFNHLVEGDCDSAKRHEEFYNEYLSVLDLTEEFYLQTIRDIFQEHKLPEGKLMHRGKLVKPAEITKTALFTIEGEKDDISGIGQTQAAHALCTGLPDDMQQDYVQPGVGHYGVFSGSRFRDEIHPRVMEFMRTYMDMKKEAAFQKKNPQLFAAAK
ncbi:MAG: polyhydroxyalkanoate depolymerase [Agarilytica sp.]